MAHRDEFAHGATFAPTNEAVRDTLEGLRRWCADQIVTPALSNAAELVLAEALNNVVEHAMADRGDGRVHLEVGYDAPFLSFDLRDNGAPMPGLALPKGHLPRVDTNLDDLPEGGFGWHMIHSLTHELTYQRKAGWNHLHFRLSDNA